MKIPRLTVVTLGVADLSEATKFYQQVLGTPPNTTNEGVTFIELPGTWLSLFPLEHGGGYLPEVDGRRGGFSGSPWSQCSQQEDVIAIIERVSGLLAPASGRSPGGLLGRLPRLFSDLAIIEIIWAPCSSSLRMEPFDQRKRLNRWKDFLIGVLPDGIYAACHTFGFREQQMNSCCTNSTRSHNPFVSGGNPALITTRRFD
jgi:catechol 2,3-dioxygenase-like lactoylglutathione lyase family enzyme